MEPPGRETGAPRGGRPHKKAAPRIYPERGNRKRISAGRF
jgi:hypothetical protein